MSLHYRIGVADLHAHHFTVTLRVPRPSAAQRLSLPVWIPGSYLVREFARHLVDLQARQGEEPVRLEQVDKASWIAHCEGQTALTVSYRVYAFDASVRTAWLDAQRGFFNGTSVFLRVEGREGEVHELEIAATRAWPKAWSVATSLPALRINRQGLGRYQAADYDELVDHPVELGTFWRGGFSAWGVPHEFIVAGAGPNFDGERLLADTKRICETEIALWHPPAGTRKRPQAPFSRYVFMLNAVEDGYGGLEHRASTALIAARRDLPSVGQARAADGYVTLLGLISHEYFHTWNVKRLRPREFARFDYTRENHTELLWFFEGFTSYYDDLVLLRAGLIDAPRYLGLLGKTLSQVLATPGRKVQSLAQASFDAWTKYYRPDENTANATVSYYTKGALVALALDLSLRATPRADLDTLMRRLWALGPDGQGGPIGEDDIVREASALAGRSLAGEIQAWVHGTEDLPLPRLLSEHGISWTDETPTLAQRLGARIADSAMKVQAVMHQGLAEQAGLAAGDEILAFDGWRCRKLDDLLMAGACQRPGTLLVARDQRLFELPLGRAEQARGSVSLGLAERASPPARRRRKAWLQADSA